MITWITSNISSGLVVTNDDYGNYTVSGVGTFTITGNNYCFNERVTIVINVTISNN